MARKYKISKKKLGQRIREGRKKAKLARARGIPKKVIQRAKKLKISKTKIYYKAGNWHVPRPDIDKQKKAKKKLRGNTYDPQKYQEWREDHNRQKRL